MLRCFIVGSVLTSVAALSTYTRTSEDGRYSVDDIKVVKHRVVTEDLYILEIHRIQNINRGIRRKKNPVLLFHGLFHSSDRFVRHGRNLSLACSLADAGFDVWLGNNRGNAYSKKHVVLNPDDDNDKFKFFNYTYEDIGIYDVAAIVDYITDNTSVDKVHYIGHSQGGTAFLALNSLKPEYNDRFMSANLLSGAGYQKHFPNQEVTILSDLSDRIYQFFLLLGIVEIFPNTAKDHTEVDDCFGENNFTELCEVLSAAEILEKNPISSGAIKQLAHFGQNINSSLFRRWNYGEKKNLELYGTKEPPLYNLGLITVPSTLHYSIGDKLVDGMDVIDMANDMVNARARKVARDDFGHRDYVDAPDAKELVYDFIIDALLNNEGNANPETRVICKTVNDVRDTATRNTNTSILIFLMITLNII